MSDDNLLTYVRGNISTPLVYRFFNALPGCVAWKSKNLLDAETPMCSHPNHFGARFSISFNYITSSTILLKYSM